MQNLVPTKKMSSLVSFGIPVATVGVPVMAVGVPLALVTTYSIPCRLWMSKQEKNAISALGGMHPPYTTWKLMSERELRREHGKTYVKTVVYNVPVQGTRV